MTHKSSLNILVAPLNWGLGHATRCIPIITHLLEQGHHICIGSDGEALNLLRQEFPQLKHYELSCSKATYASHPFLMNARLGYQAFKLIASIKKEQRLCLEIDQKEQLDLIISDNRIGLRLAHITSVIISHQLQVLSGPTSAFTSKLHAHYLKKFDQIWVPDQFQKPRLSGQLSEHHQFTRNANFIGIPSRLYYQKTELAIDYLIILSGPEPLRSKLEERLIFIFKAEVSRTILVRGKVEANEEIETVGQLSIYNYLTSQKLNQDINAAKCVICRSGYTSILDLAKLGKKAFLIPTPGQYEQAYLAKHLKAIGAADYCEQEEISLDRIKNAQLDGFNRFETQPLQLDLEHLKLR
jgi:predicted glycosyltransferase